MIPLEDEAEVEDDYLMVEMAPFRRWSWDTYAYRARWSMNVARKRAAARWKVRAWEKNFAAYSGDGHERVCVDCGSATSPRDPVFDLCRACERQWRIER